MNADTYYDRSETSGSDLSWLKGELLSDELKRDFTNALRMGSLIDAMITETSRVNYFKFQLDGEQYTTEEFELCEKMKRAFRQDEFCVSLLRQSTGQMVKSDLVKLAYCGFEFELMMRCKYDLWNDHIKWGGDIKSTTATNEDQFRAAIDHFDYDRQRVTYMLISGAQKDMTIGISKTNFKIFKVPITRGDELWKSGYEKLSSLAFKWVTLFDNFHPVM